MKSYKQFCGVAKALDVLGGRWTLLLVRDLLLGPRRYSDLLASHPGLTTNLLADRLKVLVAEGLVEKRKLPPPAGSTVYALTPEGLALEPIVLSLGAFGQRYLTELGEGDRTDIRWFGVSLRRRFSSEAPPFTAQLVNGGVPVHLAWDGTSMTTRDGRQEADITLVGDVVPLVLMGRAPASAVEIRGDASLLEVLQQGLA